nr:cathepsin W isoform X1 [Pogona vitticeps]
MWPATLPVGLVVWGAWVLSPPATAALPPDLSMAQMIQMFQDFRARFNRTYQTQEETHERFKVFVQNLARSRDLQASELGTAQYGVTRFSDLTENEFAEKFGLAPPSLPGWLPIGGLSKSPLLRKESKSQSCDWRKAGAVTAVKDQGMECKSCWAFATASNIEALWNIHRHLPRNVSVQEIIDCAYQKKGCNGGFVWQGLLSVLNSSGLSGSELYPYVGRNQTCQKHRGRKVTTIDGYEVLPRDEKYLASVVASQGPVTALLNMKVLQGYQKGIIRRPSQACSPNHLDHAVVIVGFGDVKSRRGSWTGSYWIIQNSWGEHWGEKGYFRLNRGSNTCGIAMYAVTAIVKDSGKKTPPPCPGI